jgi:integrase
VETSHESVLAFQYDLGADWGRPWVLRGFCVACRFGENFSRRKTIMAWLEQRGKQFHLGIRLGNRKLKRSLQTCDAQEAQEVVARVERRLRLLELGDLVMPDGSDVMTFLLSDGKLTQPTRITAGLSLAALCDQYLVALSPGSIEENTLKTMKVHLRHLRAALGNGFAVQQLKFTDLQRYVDARASEFGRQGQPLKAVTIKKELTTFNGVWAWGIRAEVVKGVFPNKGLRYPKTTEKPAFQTWEEIERQIRFGGLSSVEQTELWRGLYLTATEIQDVLDYVEANAPHPVMYPLFVLAAHTGARRSEILRGEITDFDLPARVVRFRELKRGRGKRTMRSVPMSTRLLSVVEAWLKRDSCRFPFHIGGETLTANDASHLFDRTLAGSRWEKIRGWHVFRHSFISNCASRGIDQRMIDAWSGHQTEEMRKRYRHLFPTVQREALESVFGQ